MLNEVVPNVMLPVGKGLLGTVRMFQGRHRDALGAYEEARVRFAELDEPGGVAMMWHQMGMAYQESRRPEAAEDAFRKSLAITVRIGDVTSQTNTLESVGGPL